uniref:Uncharacterized protein n=1 Tax=Arundo donax TaxID=35708 RepID=A0A0A9GZ67_ARUDO
MTVMSIAHGFSSYGPAEINCIFKLT